MIATVVFCVAMRWLSEEAGLQRSAKSWKVTTWLFVIIYLIPVGSLSCAAAIATAWDRLSTSIWGRPLCCSCRCSASH
ncbi:hypothetical protein I545_6655 [Mycobacterium kansasii 662]|uniref:Uncharacterized protein n=1 Tax=Mycobacterium kansasii 662 TaxID=1299326 RepID=X7Y6J5_MYCKA|nr:hypothetical protein I545_6655 [Mycobacterium kansasii 662]